MKAKRRVTLSGDRAAEFFVGGICGCMQIADRMSLGASVGAALISALYMALPKLPTKGLVKAYHNIGGDDLPPGVGAALLAATARKPPPEGRSKRARTLPRRKR